MRHIIDFRNTSDTGEIDADAIVPYNDGESADQIVLRRPVENTRTRSETLRTSAREHVIMRDVDRNDPCIWGGGTITFNGTVAGGGGGDGKFTTTASIFVVPMLTAGDGVGSTAPYVASTKAYLNVGSAGNNQVIIESVKKQFEGSDLAKADANRLSVEILNDTAESIALEGATGDVNNVKITIISGTTTADDLIDLINNDATVSQYISASLESTSTGTNAASLWGPTEWGTDYTQRFLSGGVAGVIHEVPTGSLSSFFAADSENPLQKGDTLAIYYDAIIDASGTGGVLQSTVENSNTSIGAGGLFNTRREPAKCPNAIPICKCIDDSTLLFASGAYIKKDIPATLYADSANETVLSEVIAARNSVTFGAKASLDERIEAVDTHASTIITVGPTGSGRMYEGDSALYNALNAYKDAGATIVCDQHTYTLDASLTITKAIHIAGKGDASNSQARLNFGTNLLTFNGAEYSSITNMYFYGTASTTQLYFNLSPWCCVRNCAFGLQVYVEDSSYFTMLNCDNVADSDTQKCLTIGLDTKYSLMHHCTFISVYESNQIIVDINGQYTTFDTCYFIFEGGNYINAGGYATDCTFKNINIKADLDVISTEPLLTIFSGSLVENLRIYKNAATPLIQKVLFITGGTAKNVYIHCADQEIRYTSTFLIRVTTSDDEYIGTLDGFHITNFYLPFDANTLDPTYPLIALASPTGSEVHLRNGIINNMGHNTASGDMDVCLIGSYAPATGPFIIKNGQVDTTGITYATGTRYIISRVPAGSNIEFCRITGTGLFTKGIYVDNVNNVDIAHNIINIADVWANAIHVHYQCYYVNCVHNKIIINASVTGNIIWYEGSAGSPNSSCNISHNTIRTESGTPAGNGIYLDNTNYSIVIGNISQLDGAGEIVYNDALYTIPASADIGTLNVVT